MPDGALDAHVQRQGGISRIADPGLHGFELGVLEQLAGLVLDTTNKNSVPNDPRSPFVTSGLRIGTPAVTTRGFGVRECEQLAGWLCDVLEAWEAGGSVWVTVRDRVRKQVVELCRRYPVYR